MINDMVINAEEEAVSRYPCHDPEIERVQARDLVDAVLAWGRSEFGIEQHFLPVEIDQKRYEGTTAELRSRWGDVVTSPPMAACAQHSWTREGAIQPWVTVNIIIATDQHVRIVPTEHVILHESAHLIVGDWPDIIDGKWYSKPEGNSHGLLFARRHLDIVRRFHPNCRGTLEKRYSAHNVPLVDGAVAPASWWNLPRSSSADRARIMERGQAPLDPKEVILWLNHP